MNTSLLRMARRLWPVAWNVPPQTARANQRKWAHSVAALGPKWKLGTYRAQVNTKAAA